MHARFRTDAHKNLTPRFNERFLLSLKSMPLCLMLDDSLDVLPWARQTLHIEPVEAAAVRFIRQKGERERIRQRESQTAIGYRASAGSPCAASLISQAEDPQLAELKELKQSLADTQPAGSLVARAATLDQAAALLKFIEAISEKTLRSTVALTAARGRGKSATMGLAVAGAVAYG